MEVIGLDRLERRLRELPRQLKEAARAEIENSGSLMVGDVRRNVRVDSGNLRASIDAAYQKDRMQVEVGWRDQDDLYALFHERGTRRTPANPTLIPALERAGQQFVQRLKDEVRRQIR
ncbi:phage protein, HK97 gp10 family protein [Streptomyces turgidiscabies Car8]|uniref:Phage protein, HK97 gp10 family protein n=1 Tax=Streptomyces turgidiscabies (strain Car8) TaxID=698760 RepID=L7EQN5_STRT8|nr:phage protein, HK97 gp10 family protein [Streptomyces turgidiscabies Car8]